MNISTEYRMLNKLKIKYGNVTYTNFELVGATVVVLQWKYMSMNVCII